jgi:HAD superfamily hydrolase (TIGR01490 family)
MKTAAFFDVDGTLYTAHMWRGLMEYARTHGRKTRTQLYYSALLPLYLLRKLGLISEETFRRPWVAQMGWIISGWSEAEAQAAFHWIAEEFIRPTARNDILAVLKNHVEQGHTVVLVSAMLAPILKLVGEPLGATFTVGSQTEIKEGHVTGKIGRVCMGINKDTLTRETLQANNIDVDWAASYAYADSYSDLPLFQMVGHPIAVYPDDELAKHAKENNWQVLPK